MAREQRLVFGEVADAYQQHRPTYPDGVFDAIVELAGLAPGDPVLDVGAGTGKATESLVARAFDVTAIEPSPEMARVLQSRLPAVTVHVSGFEDAVLEVHHYAVITAAQSWHWVDPARGPRKAHEVLRPRGWLALFWNGSALDDCEWHDELQPIYKRIAPEMAHDTLHHAQDSSVRVRLHELSDSGLFDEPVVCHVPWVTRYSTDQYIALLGTHSNHRLLPDEQRAALHTAIAESIGARGGEIEHPYTTDLVAARVK